MVLALSDSVEPQRQHFTHLQSLHLFHLDKVLLLSVEIATQSRLEFGCPILVKLKRKRPCTILS
jgi:hypothetical protein